MKLIKISILAIIIASATSCASGYKLIQPNAIKYLSTHVNKGVQLEYKYDLLDKKYAKNEERRGVRLVAVKITNNSERDITFGKDAKLVYENGIEIYAMDTNKVYKTLKQSPASYLWYLLLTPVNFYTTKTSSSGFQQTTSSTPIGLVLGPGIATGNMIAAGSANKKFKTEMLDYNIYGTLIRKGETKYGLIGIKTNSFDTLQLDVEGEELITEN